MAIVKNNLVSISAAILFKEVKGVKKFFLIKPKEDEDWQIPKITVRRGESSVRASIRMISEQGGINARVLEEVNRSSGAATINGRPVTQKYYFYLLLFKAGGEILGFGQHQWLEYAKAAKKLTLKREKDALSAARGVIKEWEKTKKQFQKHL